MADDRIAAAVGELYGGDPATFTHRRGELAAAARSAGDREAARAIAALRKPTRTAWVVNTLARADPGAAAKLAELAAALRAAEQARHGQRLRELSAARGPLIDALTDQALALAGLPEPPLSVRAEVAGTLTAALADPEVFSAFSAGRLTSAVQWAGFGMAPALEGGEGGEAAEPTAAESGLEERASAVADSRGSRRVPEPRTEPASQPLATVIPLSRSAARRSAARQRRTPSPEEEAPGASAPGAGSPGAGTATERRMAAEAARLAREAAERAAVARARYEDAERTVAATSAASAEAVEAEDRLEAEVRDLEERLIQARDDLAAARMRARRAEAAERRARQVLGRLPSPE